MIFESEQLYCQSRSQPRQKQTYVEACGWIEDNKEHDDFDKDNPVKINRMNWNIDESNWIKDSFGLWRDTSNKNKQPPTNQKEDIITTFKKLGTQIDEMPAQQHEVPAQKHTSTTINMTEPTIKPPQINFNKKGQSDSGTNASATEIFN